MNRVRVTLVTFAISLLAAASAHAGTIVLPRAGQVGVSVQGQWGVLTKSGKIGEEFGSGPGMGVKLRYRMRYERGFGLSFDSQSMDAREPGKAEGAFLAIPDSGLVRDRAVLNSAGIEMYQFFGTRSRTVKHLNAGLGITQISARLSNGEVQYPLGGDGFYLSAGGGIEKFVYRSWAIDVNARYQAIFHDAKINHVVQLGLGMIFYAAY